MYNAKILNRAVSSIIELAENVSDDRMEHSMVYHLLKFIRGTVRDFPQNTGKTTVDILGAYAAKIKRSTDGEISKFVALKLHANYEKGEVIPLPITNANEALLHLIQQNLRKKNRDNYSAIHKILWNANNYPCSCPLDFVESGAVRLHLRWLSAGE